MTNATATDFVIDAAPVIPVVVIEDASKAADLAKALVDGGLPCIEITLRTPAAMAALEAVAGVEGRHSRCGHCRDAGAVASGKGRGRAVRGFTGPYGLSCWTQQTSLACPTCPARRRQRKCRA